MVFVPRFDPEKVKAVETWATSLGVKEFQCFLGLASYSRRLVFGFSIIVEPLYKLCRKNAPFKR